MNAVAYRQAIELAIAIALEPTSCGTPLSFESRMCFFVGALSVAISTGDPALAARIKLVGQRAIAASQTAAPGGIA